MRLAQFEDLDLNLFEFDLDLTMMIFFLNSDERIYGRYGGRDAVGPDSRQSLAGLNYSMRAALESHRSAEATAQRESADPLTIRQITRGRFGRCVHCHQAKEIMHADLKRKGEWTRDLLWSYPPPDNLGVVLEVDRGNVVERVEPDSPADRIGLQAGDVVRRLNGVPVSSFGDAQFALERAQETNAVEIQWLRGDRQLIGEIELPEGWRRSDISWRPSLQVMVPSARLYGRDLTSAEREDRGLSGKQLAFWQKYPVHSQAEAAGVREGDIVLGFDGKLLEMDAYDFLSYVRGNYVVGDQVTVNILREGQRLSLPMTLRPFDAR